MNRDTAKYILKDGNKVVYCGTSNNLSRREQEHHREGMQFTSLQKIGYLTTREAAGNWEEEYINNYRQQHGGRRPKYNRNDSGK